MLADMNETTPAVRAEGLVKSFGDQRAVDHVDLEVRRGQVFGVLGPNGAGKTTMLKMLATLLPVDDGRAEVFGHDVRREPHVVRQLLGVTGQYASVDENLTATENLLLFARLQGVGKAEARRTAATLLEQEPVLEHREPAEGPLLSGRQQVPRPPDHRRQGLVPGRCRAVAA